MTHKIQWVRVSPGTSGKPRYVCHYTVLSIPVDRDATPAGQYTAAIRRAARIGGKKYHNKDLSGGIAFQPDSLEELEAAIYHVTGRMK